MKHQPKVRATKIQKIEQGAFFAFGVDGKTFFGFSVQAEKGDRPDILALFPGHPETFGRPGLLSESAIRGPVVLFPNAEAVLATTEVHCGHTGAILGGILFILDEEPIVALPMRGAAARFFSLNTGAYVHVDDTARRAWFSRWQVGHKDATGNWTPMCTIEVSTA
jgi:hypothetical protein